MSWGVCLGGCGDDGGDYGVDGNPTFFPSGATAGASGDFFYCSNCTGLVTNSVTIQAQPPCPASNVEPLSKGGQILATTASPVFLSKAHVAWRTVR